MLPEEVLQYVSHDHQNLSQKPVIPHPAPGPALPETFKNRYMQRKDQNSPLPFSGYLFPAATLLAGLFVLAMPLPTLIKNPHILPMLLTGIIFYWGMRTPDFLPAPLVFMVGLVADIFVGTPLGYWTLCYLFIYALSVYFNRISRRLVHVYVWGTYLLLSFLTLCLAWLITSFYLFTPEDPVPYLKAWLSCALAFPLTARLLGNLRRLA